MLKQASQTGRETNGGQQAVETHIASRNKWLHISIHHWIYFSFFFLFKKNSC